MSNSGQGDVFDVRKIRRLVELMNEHDLAEVELRQGDQRIRLRRHGDPPLPASPTPQPLPAELGGTASIVPSNPSAPPATTPVVDESTISWIKSPMVGTFYTAASPESSAFVNVGDHVGPESTVCIVEAMKVFNEIPAECSGQIVAVLVENGDPVEFGQPLFKVDTNA